MKIEFFCLLTVYVKQYNETENGNTVLTEQEVLKDSVKCMTKKIYGSFRETQMKTKRQRTAFQASSKYIYIAKNGNQPA